MDKILKCLNFEMKLILYIIENSLKPGHKTNNNTV